MRIRPVVAADFEAIAALVGATLGEFGFAEDANGFVQGARCA